MATREQELAELEALERRELAALEARARGGAAPAAPKKPATFVSTAKRAAYNLPMDTALVLKGTMQQFGPEGLVAQAVTRPRETYDATVGEAARILSGGMQKVRELSPAEHRGSAPALDTTSYDKAAKALYDAYGTKQNVYRTVGNSPAAHIAPFVPGAPGALKRLPVGGVSVKKTLARTFPDPEVPTVAELKKSSKGLYDEAEKAGVVINSQSYAQFSDSVRQKLKAEGVNLSPASGVLYPKTSAALRTIMETEGDVSLNDLETLRRVGTAAAETTDKADRRMARILVDEIDDYAENLSDVNIKSGDRKAIAKLGEARSTWARAARGETIDKLIERSQLEGGSSKLKLDEAYRRNFKKLANNERGMKRFTKEQQEAIKKVAYGDGPAHNFLNGLGRLIPTGQSGMITTGALGASAALFNAPLVGAFGAVAAPAAIGGKIASTRITSRNARRVSEMARSANYAKIKARRDARKAQEK